MLELFSANTVATVTYKYLRRTIMPALLFSIVLQVNSASAHAPRVIDCSWNPKCGNVLAPCCCSSPCPVNNGTAGASARSAAKSQARFFVTACRPAQNSRYSCDFKEQGYSADQPVAGQNWWQQSLDMQAALTGRIANEGPIQQRDYDTSVFKRFVTMIKELVSGDDIGDIKSNKLASGEISGDLTPLTSFSSDVNEVLYSVGESVDEVSKTKTKRQKNVLSSIYSAQPIALSYRERLQSFNERFNALQILVEQSQSLGDDLTANAAVRAAIAYEKSQLGLGEAEITEAFSVTEASSHSLKEPDPVLMPMGTASSAFSGLDDLSLEFKERREAMLDLSRARKEIILAVFHYNQAVQNKDMENLLPTILETIKEHDGLKGDLFKIEIAMENSVARVMRNMRINETGKDHWDRLKVAIRETDSSTFFTNSGVYGPGNRYFMANVAQAQFAPWYDARYGVSSRSGDRFISENSPLMETAPGRIYPSYHEKCRRRYKFGYPHLEEDEGCFNGAYVGEAWLAAASLRLKSEIGALYPYQIDLWKRVGRNWVPRENFEVGIQYWLEAQKREAAWSSLRRGPGASKGPGMGMTDRMWAEMALLNKDCFYGPLEFNDDNFDNYTDFFDVKADCGPRRWRSEFAPSDDLGELIPGSELGGADSVAWNAVSGFFEADLRDFTYDKASEHAKRALAALKSDASDAAEWRGLSIQDLSRAGEYYIIKEAANNILAGDELASQIYISWD